MSKPMKITIESDLLLPPIARIISILTDKAKICVNDIHHDEATGVIDIYLQRKQLIGFKKMFLGKNQPVYSENMIKSLLTIKEVEEMNIIVDERLETENDSCFTVLFGLKVDSNQLYLGSVEETQGKILCQIQIKVKGMNIELGDEQ